MMVMLVEVKIMPVPTGLRVEVKVMPVSQGHAGQARML